MKITAEMLDPFPIPLEKHKHLFEEGKRVTVTEGAHRGRSGTLKAINTHNGHVVQLDSGHLVEYRDHELEPEGFGTHSRAHSGAEVSRVQKAYDPFPGLDDDPIVRSGKPFSRAAAETLRPFIKSSGGLMRALESGTVSIADRVLIKSAFENIETHRVNVHPLDLFGETEEHNARILRIMAEKYAGTTAGGTFTKAAHRADTDPEFSVGDRVRHKLTLKKGRISRLDYGFADLAYDDGVTGVTTCDQLEKYD